MILKPAAYASQKKKNKQTNIASTEVQRNDSVRKKFINNKNQRYIGNSTLVTNSRDGQHLQIHIQLKECQCI